MIQIEFLYSWYISNIVVSKIIRRKLEEMNAYKYNLFAKFKKLIWTLLIVDTRLRRDDQQLPF